METINDSSTAQSQAHLSQSQAHMPSENRLEAGITALTELVEMLRSYVPQPAPTATLGNTLAKQHPKNQKQKSKNYLLSPMKCLM